MEFVGGFIFVCLYSVMNFRVEHDASDSFVLVSDETISLFLCKFFVVDSWIAVSDLHFCCDEPAQDFTHVFMEYDSLNVFLFLLQLVRSQTFASSFLFFSSPCQKP